MAELRKITKSAPISGFSQVGPEGGSAFLAFADMANQAYEFLKPAAIAEMGQRGAEAGAEMARRQIGQNGFPVVPQAQPKVTPGGLSNFSPDDDAFIASLSGTESGGNWNALNNEVGAGGARGHGGRLQFGNARLSEAASAGIIRPMTAQEFAQQPASVQRAVETWHFGDIDLQAQQKGLGVYLGQTIGGVKITQSGIRAMAHLGGIGGAEKFLKSGGSYNPSDSFGTSLSDYARKHGGIPTAAEAGVNPDAGMALVESSTAELAVPETPPTLVRTASGKIEPRMFSPLSGEILQAHNAAASTAYLSEMLVKGGTDMMGLSETFIGNPSGYQGAAQSYIDEVVANAPAMMKGDLRQKLTQSAQQRYLGMVEEQQRDVRQRAANSSKALMDRYQEDYAEALAAGNFEEAASVRSSLEEVLIARQSLPGLAWTPEQSQNVILGAQDHAARIAEQNRVKVRSEQAGTLRTIIAAAEQGRSSADEAILDDPAVIANNPELAEEAAAKIALREAMPGFFQLPPSEMDAVIADERARPVTEGWELDLVGPMERARDSAVKALGDDPIAYAEERFAQKPPAIDNFSPEDPGKFISSLAARRDYVNGMVEDGYIDRPAYLSKSEIESLSAVMGKDTPPEVRSAIAGAIVSGFGADAGQVFKALKVDGVTAWAGAMMAKGGSEAVAAEAIRGQAMIDEKLAQLPPEKDWTATMQSEFRATLADLPADSVQAEADVLKFAKAIYASRASAPGFEADKNSMRDAIQAALGQTTNPRGETVGGVQDFFGQPVLMPSNINAERAQKALTDGMMANLTDGQAFGSIWGGIDASSNPEFWSRISVQSRPDGTIRSGGVPRVGGDPLPLKMITGGDVRFVPVGGTSYRMEVQRSGSVLDVHTPEGTLYIVDLSRL